MMNKYTEEIEYYLNGNLWYNQKFKNGNFHGIQKLFDENHFLIKFKVLK